MRLANRLRDKIKKSALNSFGDVDVFLFGSRVDDTKRGGDIDIAVDVDLQPDEFRKNKIKFMVELIKLGFDLKIDVVPFKGTDKLLNDEVHKTALRL